jgi:hypothetical protein
MKIMKTYNKAFVVKAACLAFVLSVSITACDEDALLNPVPDTSLQAELAFDTPSRILGQINGIYTSLKNGNYLGGRDLMLRDIKGEDFLNLTQNLFTGFETWAQNLNSGSNDALSTWTAAYTTINSANLFLDGIVLHPGVVSDVLAAQYIAEAKFCRALSYHKLITMYAQPYAKDGGASPGVPLRLAGESDTQNNSMARSTVAQVYAQIIKDLDEAEAGLPSTYSTALLNTSRAHKNTAIALKTRIYLAMGNYAKVIQEGDKIVPAAAPYRASTGVANALVTSIATVFATPWTTAESIFSMPMTTLNNVGGQSSLPNSYNGTREYSLNMVAGSGIMADPTIRTSDARKAMTRVLSGATFLTKFPSTGSPFLEYIPVVRYSEVMLNLAEAAAKSGGANLVRGAALLNAVRQRADAGYPFPPATLTTQTLLISAIRIERRIEFIGEGFRSDDLYREMLTMPTKGSAPSVAPTASNYVFPIPNGEISNNPGL